MARQTRTLADLLAQDALEQEVADLIAEAEFDMETERRVERWYEGEGRYDACWGENQADLALFDMQFPNGYRDDEARAINEDYR